MVLTDRPNPHDRFMQALTDLDPVLAGAFDNVRRQTPGDAHWQYLWASPQHNQGTLLQDREAAKLFQAYSVTRTNTPDDLLQHHALKLGEILASPYHCLVDDYEISERRFIDETSFRWADDDPAFTARQRRSLDDLLRTLRDDLSYAAVLITRGLRYDHQGTYAQGLDELDRVYHHAS